MKNMITMFRDDLTGNHSLGSLTGLFFIFISMTGSISAEQSGLIVNEDNSHFLATRSPEQMTVENIQDFVDQYAGTQVTHLFLCPNAMRTNYRSNVWTSIWDGNHPETIPSPDEQGWAAKRWVHNAWLLDQKGLDLYKIWIDRCREKGISPWLSIRMNDIHSVKDMDNFMHSRFWKKNSRFWRVPQSAEHYTTMKDRALDYSHKEVRDYSMALIRELLERYDTDGIELDWMRFPYHFRPGYEEKGRVLLTEFMRQVRQLTRQWSKKRGHPINVSARVPAVPTYARDLGLDGVAWAKQGLIDILVPSPFWDTADFDIPIEQWRELIGPDVKNITLAVTMEHRIHGSPDAKAIYDNPETLRGFAVAMLHRGADQIYLFNHMDSGTAVAANSDYQTLLKEAGRLDTVLGKPRRHVLTFHDTYPIWMHKQTFLPAKLKTHRYAPFRLYTGPLPTTGQVILRAGLIENQGYEQAKVAARVNSVDCNPLTDAADPESLCNSKRVVQLNVPLDAMQEGYNMAELTIENEPVQQIDWLEFYILP